MRRTAQSFVALSTALSVACSGSMCGRSGGGAVSQAAGGGASGSVLSSVAGPARSAAELRQPLMTAHRAVAAALGHPTDPNRLSVADVTGSVERLIAAAETSARALRRETFEVGAVARGVGVDPVKAFEWVRDHTSLVAYRGVLRGPTGVLLDRVGNSLDRALLLAELVRTAGIPVRLAHGQLSMDEARAVRQGSRPLPTRPSMPVLGVPADVAAALAPQAVHGRANGVQLRQAVEALAAATEGLTQGVTQRVGQQTQALARTVPAAGALASESGAAEVEALRDHWWVQAQQRTQWVDLDPATPDAAPGRAVGRAAEVLAPADLPRSLYHDVVVRVVIERWSDGRLEEATALEHAVRPFEILGQRVVLQHAPLNWPSNLPAEGVQAAAQLLAAFQAQREWLPALRIGTSRPVIQASITASGHLNPTPGAARPVSASPGFGGVLDGLGGGDEAAPEPEGHLTAEWIEYEIRSPGRASDRIRRDVFDLIGPAARATGAVAAPQVAGPAALRRAMALAGETELLPLVAQLSPEFVRHVMNTAVLSQREPLRELLRTATAGPPTEAQFAKLSAVSGELYALALLRTRFSPVRDQVYLDRPNIVSLHWQIQPTDRGGIAVSKSLDIVANAVAARPTASRDIFQARLAQGVTDTAAEAIVIGDGCGGCGLVANVSELWVAARPEDMPWVVLQRPDDPAWRGVGLDTDTRRRVEQDLRAGHVVLIPPRPVTFAGRATVGWWRIDPRSGHTLGVMQSGQGQASVEYVTTAAMIAVGIGGGLLAARGCLGTAEARASAGPGKTVACYLCGMGYGFATIASLGALGVLSGLVATLSTGSICGFISVLM